MSVQLERSAPPLAMGVTVEAGSWPADDDLAELALRVAGAVFAELRLAPAPLSELGIQFSDDATVQSLNARWRGKNKPTNVLSFPAMPLPKNGSLPPLLGDIVLAAETVRGEAEAENKPLESHIAHLLAHGLLHLLGYDHEAEAEAEAMEDVEGRVLARLAFPDPYA